MSPAHQGARAEAPSRLSQGVVVTLLVLWWMPLLPSLVALLSPTWLELVSDPGVGVTDPSRSQFAILAIVALIFAGWRPSRPISAGQAGWWVAAFLLWSVLSSVSGPDLVGSLTFMFGWLAAACVLQTAPRFLDDELSPTWQLALFHAPLILLGAVCLAPMPWSTGEFRAAGPFQLPGALANWLLMLLPLAFVSLFRSRGAFLPLALASCAVGVSTLVMTVSRAAWLVGLLEFVLLVLWLAKPSRRSVLAWAAFGAGGLGLLVMGRHLLGGLGLLGGVTLLALTPLVVLLAQKKLKPVVVARMALAGALCGLLLWALQPETKLTDFAEERMSTLAGTDESAVGRLQFWKAALTLSLQHPLLGVAPGRFSEAYPRVQQYYYYFSDSAHGTVVELLAEVGWVGGALLLVALICLLRPVISDDGARKPRLSNVFSWREAAFLGVAMGAIYSQVEVSYHFAALWTTAAFLLAAVVAQPAESAACDNASWWLSPLLLPLIALLLLQTAHGRAVRQSDVEQAYRQARVVSDRLPIWSRPALHALSQGLAARRPPEDLAPLVRRVLRWAPGNAVSYQLAGEYALQAQDYPQAIAWFQRSLELDGFNRPGSYHGLLVAASATGNTALTDSVAQQVLEVYDLDKGWGIAHSGHRQKLALELRPLLYDLADSLTPYREPEITEKLYRFLLDTGDESARAIYGLGVALVSQGKTSQGEALMRQAHALDPLYPLP